MTSTRNVTLLFCLGIFVFCAFQIYLFDSHHDFQATIAKFASSDSSFVFLKTNRNETLGIASKIYVLSLPTRTDRHREMEHLRKALDLRWTYMEAIDARNAVIERIMDSVQFIRHTHGVDSFFSWPDQEVPVNDRMDLFDPEFLVPLSTHLAKPARSQPLVCATQNDTIVPYEANLPEHKILTPARVACWYSHAAIIHTIANDFSLNANDAVIVLEDDVDMERDILERIQRLWKYLPSDWDIVYLGHCWSDESVNKALDGDSSNATETNTTQGDTHIHPSVSPLCTHAYALSRSGARRLLLHLRHPVFAYSRSIDKAISWLIESGRLKSFSIVPSIVVQRKAGTSDIMSGKGSGWRAELVNGVFGNRSSLHREVVNYG